MPGSFLAPRNPIFVSGNPAVMPLWAAESLIQVHGKAAKFSVATLPENFYPEKIP